MKLDPIISAVFYATVGQVFHISENITDREEENSIFLEPENSGRM